MSEGAAALCIVLDAGFLGAGLGAVNPEAMAVLGTAVRLSSELALSPLGYRVDVVLEDDGAGATEIARNLAGRDFETVSVGEDFASACGHNAARVVIARTLREVEASTVWVLGDEFYGLADIADADRRFREVLGVPVPRPLPPDMITGELICLPDDTPLKTLLRATYDAERTSWAILGAQPILYSETSDQIDALLAIPRASRLSHAVHLTRLRLVGTVPEGSTSLLRLSGKTLIEAANDAAGGTPWTELRFSRLH